MDIERDGNYTEAGVWFLAAVVVFWKSFRSPAVFKRTLIALGVTLAVFGGSDIVEAHTGAWWRPWWLFVWKAACVIALLVAFVRYFQLLKGRSASEEKGDEKSE